MSAEREYTSPPNETGYVPREIVGSKAFNLEYQRSITDQELYDEVVSYLGEYRLKVPKYEYDLVFSQDLTKSGPFMLRDTHKGESMRTKAHRAIKERKHRGEEIHREIAEEKGIIHLEDQLKRSKSGDTVLWMSPPGPKEQGYGTYSFLYKGDVQKKSDGSTSLAMQAIRLNEATLNQGRAFFSTMTGDEITHETPEDFIASPVVLPFTVPENLLDKALKQQFTFEIDGKEQEKFQTIISKMEPHINEFIYMTKHGSRQEKIRAFHALENYALQLEKEYEEPSQVERAIKVISLEYNNLSALMDAHGHKPPTTGGSCGSSGGETKDNIFSSPLRSLIRNALAEAIYGDSASDCEDCGDKNTDNHYHCPGCNRQYADETNRSPEARTKECSCGFEFGCGADTEVNDNDFGEKAGAILIFGQDVKEKLEA